MKKLSPWIIFGIVLAVIAIIVLIGFLLMSEAEKADEPEDGRPVALHPAEPDGNLSMWDSKNATSAA